MMVIDGLWMLAEWVAAAWILTIPASAFVAAVAYALSLAIY